MDSMESLGDLMAKIRAKFQALPGKGGPATSPQTMNTGPKCSLCNDLSRIVHDVPYDHPDFGKSYPCPACYKPDHLRLCGVPLEHRRESFSNFDLAAFKEAGNVLKIVQSLALGSADFHMILLLGKTGVGKTHLLYAATLAVCGRGIPARYTTEAALLSDVKERMDWREEAPLGRVGYEAFWRSAQRWPFLCLDGIADVKLTEWGWSMLDELIDTRYAEGLPLIAGTNCKPTELPPRMLSRFRDTRHGRVLWLDAPDYRLRGVKAD